eukprot:CAMPEP_0114261086 /NCGR_PEP_ID=MMETSP0058-20121206/20902_1 /TAXON_ID=36894 /ORGANISM="Pyramimonas parkeae, CCMP726" /LENGTH=262 /DNA_ID=CAMNT_0001376503 /DNA_START=533 /DNA_END=1321 /DNA_ORIENTATION=-
MTREDSFVQLFRGNEDTRGAVDVLFGLYPETHKGAGGEEAPPTEKVAFVRSMMHRDDSFAQLYRGNADTQNAVDTLFGLSPDSDPDESHDEKEPEQPAGVAPAPPSGQRSTRRPSSLSQSSTAALPLNVSGKQPCNHCGEKDSPQWRKGPSDKPHLCNACGTRFLRTGSLKRNGTRQRGGGSRHMLKVHEEEPANHEGTKRQRERQQLLAGSQVESTSEVQWAAKHARSAACHRSPSREQDSGLPAWKLHKVGSSIHQRIRC